MQKKVGLLTLFYFETNLGRRTSYFPKLVSRRGVGIFRINFTSPHTRSQPQCKNGFLLSSSVFSVCATPCSPTCTKTGKILLMERPFALFPDAKLGLPLFLVGKWIVYHDGTRKYCVCRTRGRGKTKFIINGMRNAWNIDALLF